MKRSNPHANHNKLASMSPGPWRPCTQTFCCFLTAYTRPNHTHTSLTMCVFRPVSVFFVTFCVTSDLLIISMSKPRSHKTSTMTSTARSRSHAPNHTVVGIVADTKPAVVAGGGVAASVMFQCNQSTDSRPKSETTVMAFDRIHKKGTNVSVLLMSNGIPAKEGNCHNGGPAKCNLRLFALISTSDLNQTNHCQQ